MSLWKLIRARWGSGAGETDDVRIDALTNALIIVDFAHHEAHEGCAFHSQAFDLSMGNSDTLILAFKTPPGTNRAHMLLGFITNGDAHMELIESPTWTNQTGALNPIYNRKRGAGSSALLEDQAQAGFVASDNLILNPTDLAGGTSVLMIYSYAERAKAEAGVRGDSEWILAPDTQYAVLLTSDVTSNSGQILLDWYEHADSH